MKILVAEDEEPMRKIIRLYFEKEGFRVITAADGEEALELLYQNSFDLVILDWMMPKRDGLSVCKEIKSLGLPVKVLMLTAKGHTEDEIKGLEYGADDYIKKPFEPKILLLRAKKLLNADTVMHCGQLTLDMATYSVKNGNQTLDLKRKEYELLEYFLKNQGRVLTRDMILLQVWGPSYDGDDRTVDTHIKRLRAKIGAQYISTFRGIGYCMEKQG